LKKAQFPARERRFMEGIFFNFRGIFFSKKVAKKILKVSFFFFVKSEEIWISGFHESARILKTFE